MHLLFQFGPIAVPSYGVFAAIGVLAALFLSLRLARALASIPTRSGILFVLMIFSAIVGSRLLHGAAVLGRTSHRVRCGDGLGVDAHSLVPGRRLRIALLLGSVYARTDPPAAAPHTGRAAAPLALGHAISCVGSFAAGSTFGTPTTLPWGVTYAASWRCCGRGTPQGLPLHPTQLYECLAELAIFCVLMLLLRRLAPGELMGTWLILFGISRYFLAFFRGAATVHILNDSLTVGQVLAVLHGARRRHVVVETRYSGGECPYRLILPSRR